MYIGACRNFCRGGGAKSKPSSFSCSSFSSLLIPPLPFLPSLSIRPFTSVAKRIVKSSYGVWRSAVRSRQGPSRPAAKHVLCPRNVFDCNDFGSFCANQNVVIELITLYIFQHLWFDVVLPPHGHIWDVMLVWSRGNIEKTVSVLQYCVLL